MARRKFLDCELQCAPISDKVRIKHPAKSGSLRIDILQMLLLIVYADSIGSNTNYACLVRWVHTQGLVF